MPLRTRRQCGVEQIYRKVVTPGLETVNHANKLGIRLKSVNLLQGRSSRSRSPVSAYRLQSSTTLGSRQSTCFYENIVVPLGVKNEESDIPRSYSPTTYRSASVNTKARQSACLPQVPDKRAKSCRTTFLSSYADTSLASRGVPHTESSTWNGSEQAQRLHTEVQAINRCRTLKRTSEVLPHRVDKLYYMCGATKQIHSKYDVNEKDMMELKEMSQSGYMSQSTAPSARIWPSPIHSPRKDSHSPSRQEVRKLGHIKTYAVEYTPTMEDPYSYVVHPQYMVPQLSMVSDYDMYDTPGQTNYVPDSPAIVEFADDIETIPFDSYRDGELTLGMVTDQIMPTWELGGEGKRNTPIEDKNYYMVTTPRSWSDSDLTLVGENVLDTLHLNEKGEYVLQVPKKRKMMESQRSSNVTPQPRCCSTFARRKYPTSKANRFKSGRNCKRTPCAPVKKVTVKTKKPVKKETQDYKIQFRPDSRCGTDIIMTTKMDSGAKINRIEEDVLRLQNYPIKEHLGQQPVRCECRKTSPQTASMFVRGKRVSLSEI